MYMISPIFLDLQDTYNTDKVEIMKESINRL